MTTEAAVCDRCGKPAQHLFPGSTSASRICSKCYEALRLHKQGVALSTAGTGAMVLGAALLIAIVIVLLVY